MKLSLHYLRLSKIAARGYSPKGNGSPLGGRGGRD